MLFLHSDINTFNVHCACLHSDSSLQIRNRNIYAAVHVCVCVIESQSACMGACMDSFLFPSMVYTNHKM